MKPRKGHWERRNKKTWADSQNYIISYASEKESSEEVVKS